MIDKWDIDLFQRFLALATKKGTDHIKVTVGPEPSTYIVRLIDPQPTRRPADATPETQAQWTPTDHSRGPEARA